MLKIIGTGLIAISAPMAYRAGMIQNKSWLFVSTFCVVIGILFVIFDLHEQLISIRKQVSELGKLVGEILMNDEDILENNQEINCHCKDVIQTNKKLLESLDKTLNILKEDKIRNNE